MALPQVQFGSIQRLESFPSQHVDARHVDVWLPEGFNPNERHSVVYMHDGQMLFDASTTWNQQAWEVEVAASKQMLEGRIPRTIIVGVWNNDTYRHSEYFPQQFLETVSEGFRSRFIAEALRGKPQSDAYLRFLVQELKPHIDQHFPTRPEREHTFLMGSSMGGIISVYGLLEYPQVFGGAAGLSIHWMGGMQPNFELPLGAFNCLQRKLEFAGQRLYMDHGTTELDALYAPYQNFVNEIVRDKGFDAAHWQSRVFPETGHNEQAWAGRVHIPLEFLLGRTI